MCAKDASIYWGNDMTQRLVRFDYAMKKLLRSKANFGILEGFLSELLKFDLKILNILESESNKDEKDDKYNKVDVLVELQNKEIVLIEVQVTSQSDYFHRILYGTSKIITEYINEGEEYSNIKKVYSVNILYFDLGHGIDYIYHGTTSFVGLHQNDKLDLNKTQKLLYQKEYVHQIYPEYYLLKVNQFNDIAKNTLDEWIYFLKNEEIKDSFHAKGLSEAKEKLDSMKLPTKEKQEYKRYLENLRQKESEFGSTYNTGKVDGKIEGEQIGIEKGKIEGKIEVAKKLKALGMTNETIQKATDLSLEEIEKI